MLLTKPWQIMDEMRFTAVLKENYAFLIETDSFSFMGPPQFSWDNKTCVVRLTHMLARLCCSETHPLSHISMAQRLSHPHSILWMPAL